MLKVGYIGLGLMGKSIARNILKAGFPLVVHNRSRAAVDELVAEGAIAASSPAVVAAQVDIVFTNLPDSPDVEKVALASLRMPPKSTYFYPKLMTGMVLNIFKYTF